MHTQINKLVAYLSELPNARKTGLVIIASFITILLRRPDLITNPQFWAEDGPTFYANAYNHGFDSLFMPYAGVFQTFMRLIALGVSKMPIEAGPILFNLVGITVILLPVFIIWADPHLLFTRNKERFLLLFTYLYLLNPKNTEIFGNLTNAGWYLALAAGLVLVRKNTPQARKWIPFDIAVLVLCGLTGPFCLALFLPALYLVWRYKDRATMLKAGVILVCACIQLSVFVFSGSGKDSSISLAPQAHAMAAQYDRPVKITGMRLVGLPVFGEDIMTPPVADSDQLFVLGLLVAAVFVVAMIKTANVPLKILIFYCFLMYVLGLSRAGAMPIVDFWKILQFNTFGERYFFLPFTGWVLVLIALVHEKRDSIFTHLARALLLLFVIMFPLSFAIKPLPDYGYKTYISEFKAAKGGSVSCVEVNPGGPAFNTCLVKH